MPLPDQLRPKPVPFNSGSLPGALPLPRLICPLP